MRPPLLALKRKQAVRLGIEYPTSIEVVSAHFSKYIISISEARSGTDQKSHAITHAVNLRRKTSPPCSEDSIGNFIWIAAALCKPEEATFSSILLQIRDSIAKVNGDFVDKLQGDEGFFKLYETVKKTRTNVIAPPGLSCGVDQIKFVIEELDVSWGISLTAKYTFRPVKNSHASSYCFFVNSLY
ncbi:salutaridinol 7-O-acetyltransferase-like [Mercurialis annua]|uniref:salutaridinol 7-O-acetyltransferase-like n=1 Tax=Mercurialis annua TaxID=3986 RepID=UPI002160870A|nr:salutaridinol 7-O-acetyltransferase-like [Mercurialis annua]